MSSVTESHRRDQLESAAGSRQGPPASAAPTRPRSGSRARSRGSARAARYACCPAASHDRDPEPDHKRNLPRAGDRPQHGPSARILGGGRHDADDVGAGLEVRGRRAGHLLARARARTRARAARRGCAVRARDRGAPSRARCDEIARSRARRTSRRTRGARGRSRAAPRAARSAAPPGLQRDRHPHGQARRGAGPPRRPRRRWSRERRATCSGGTRLSTTSSACRAATRVIAGPKAATRDARVRLRAAQPKAMGADVVDRRSRSARPRGSRAARRSSPPCARALCAHSRSCQPRDDRRARRTERDVDSAAGEGGDRGGRQRDRRPGS